MAHLGRSYLEDVLIASLVSLLVACAPSVGDEQTADSDGGEGEDTEAPGSTGSAPDTESETDVPVCDLPDADVLEEDAERTVRLINATDARVYVDPPACGRWFAMSSAEGSVNLCRADCAAHEASPDSPGIPSCDHCANELLVLEPGAAYETPWGGWLDEAVDVPPECGRAHSEVCSRRIRPTLPMTASIVASVSLRCDGGPSECECDPSDDGWCVIRSDLFIEGELSAEATVDPAGSGDIEVVIE